MIEKIIVHNNNRANFLFLNGTNIDFFCVDLVNFKLLFTQFINKSEYKYKGILKKIKERYEKNSNFNNLKRTKSYNIFNSMIININEIDYFVTLNIFPKNIEIRNYYINSVHLLEKLNKVSFQIYSVLNSFTNSNMEGNCLNNENNNIFQQNLLIELYLLKKIKSLLYKIKTTKIKTKMFKSNQIIGVPDLSLTDIYDLKDGIIQTIHEEEEDIIIIYIKLLEEKRKYYKQLSNRYDVKQNILQINIILTIAYKKYTTNKKYFKSESVQMLLDKLDKSLTINKYFKQLFDNLTYLKSKKDFDIFLKIYDISIIWEKYVEYYLSHIVEKNYYIKNGNKKNTKKNHLFNNSEYELKYDLMLVNQKENNNINNIVDAKFKLPKKNYMNDIIYEGNDVRQIYVYLQSYNSKLNEKHIPYGILIYPKIYKIDMKEEISININKVDNFKIIDFLNNCNNSKVFSDIGLVPYRLYFTDISFFK